MSYWRLIAPSTRDPYSNMAIDEALLREYEKGNTPPTIRFYRWEPSISLGYFQKAKNVLNLENCSKFNTPFVRRITGGEAIFHENDLSYSIVLSEKDLDLPRSIKDNFKILTMFIVNAYKSLGIKAKFFSDHQSGF